MNTNTPTSPTDPQFWGLIPCAGTGSRALSAQMTGPKQYQPLLGKALVLHTLAAFSAVKDIRATLVVVAPGDSALTATPSACLVADCGGDTRAASVTNGLDHLMRLGASAEDWVLVHDAARCLITPDQISALMSACRTDAVGGLLAHKLPDTLKREANGRVAQTLDRSDKWLAQTPQMFRIGTLRQALAHSGAQVTDESSAIEALGLSPLLVPGSAQNFKVTYPEDFALAESVLKARAAAKDAV